MTHPVSPPKAGRHPSLSGLAGQGGDGGGSAINFLFAAVDRVMIKSG